jgi:hypothetical protein
MNTSAIVISSASTPAFFSRTNLVERLEELECDVRRGADRIRIQLEAVRQLAFYGHFGLHLNHARELLAILEADQARCTVELVHLRREMLKAMEW